jgi:putative aldouronate transport system permease protein
MRMGSTGDYNLIINMINARTGRAAQLFLGALPMLCTYPFLQKYFVKGLVIGSVKG